jgi:O-acetyl-ADP-ribose deacetylase (regulator of RNase III)
VAAAGWMARSIGQRALGFSGNARRSAAVSPVWNGGQFMEKELLADCYRHSLKLARENKVKTIAFPSISTGAYRFPIETAAPIAINTVKAFAKENPGVFETIIFVLFSESDLWVFQKLL